MLECITLQVLLSSLTDGTMYASSRCASYYGDDIGNFHPHLIYGAPLQDTPSCPWCLVDHGKPQGRRHQHPRRI
ncbi:hypothetical protein HPB52_025350 [Rhipicephalus sanguineus]|uniref:Secreted protein n=1 Tax=Rhipicephalus sanguineus TaxID=34632 RepID=A0A9D4YS68_RHISA|nr:hypothetical protein HPB52_025350 [Rhipicephalus sanguineus]